MSRYYNRDGNPIGMMEWAQMHNDLKNRRVKKDELKCKCIVSTVWLGLDHSFGDGPLEIFETMTFPNKDNYNDEYQERYSTEEEAVNGHNRIVKDHGCNKATS